MQGRIYISFLSQFLRKGLFAALICLLFYSVSLQAQVLNYRLQKIESLSSISNMDSISAINPDDQPAHTWWLSEEIFDPQILSEQMLAEDDHSLNITDPFALRESWKQVPVPKNPVQLGLVSNGLVPVWYGKAILLPDPLDQNVTVRLGLISDRDRFYVNGFLVAETGDWSSLRSQPYDRHRIYDIPARYLRPGGVNIFLVHVKGSFPSEVGIIKNKTEIGPSDAMWSDFYFTNFIAILFLVLYFSAGSYFLFLYLRRRTEHANLFFALFAYALIVYQFLRTQIKYYIGIDFYYLKKIEYIFLFLLVPLLYYFFRSYYYLPRTKLVQWGDRLTMLVSFAIFIIILLVIGTQSALIWDFYNFNLVMPSWSLFIIGIFSILVYQWKQKDRDAIYFALGLSVLLVAVVVDILQTKAIVNTPRLAGYAFIAFVMSLAVILANRFVRVHEKVEDLNRNLEKKVADRTAKLQQTLNEVQELKVQQDGDYFLTTLLVKPLVGNFAKGQNTNIDFLIRQKKHFEFKNREHEIGGDLCIAHSITLRGRHYIAFVNADAMGKSIQGAGGALVLGVVFKSIIARTELLPEFHEKFPEQWIKSSFIELQNVFVSFDGSMMISLVMGLVDDENGFLYFINAEHPWSVLYRDNRASFIENEMLIRKVGIEGLNSHLQIQTFQLQSGDVIIMGSDGRDDLYMGENDQGGRSINEDELQFLYRVEEGGGHLIKIFERIQLFGELTDDFTLLRIGYQEQKTSKEPNLTLSANLAEANRLMKIRQYRQAITLLQNTLRLADDKAQQMQPYRSLTLVALKLQDYTLAAKYCQHYLDLNPADEEFLYYASYTLKKAQLFLPAIDYGERLRLRKRLHWPNCLNLADTYRMNKDYIQAEKILAEISNLPDSHGKVSALRQKIKLEMEMN